jgi:hypothetical protein
MHRAGGLPGDASGRDRRPDHRRRPDDHEYALAGRIHRAAAGAELAHIQNIRIGTKSVAYWPQRFVSDKDSDDLLRLFEKVVKAGKNLAIMGHYNHAVELRSPIAQQAVKRIVGTGATLRMQGPLIRHINEDPKSWAELWTTGVRLGAIPYYMFVERDTGPRDYFALPLARAHEIFQAAYDGVGPVAHRARTVDERLPGQGRDRRRGHDQWRKAVRAAVPAGPQSGLGAPALLRQVRPGRHLARSSETGVRPQEILLRRRGGRRRPPRAGRARDPDRAGASQDRRASDSQPDAA